MHIIHQMFLIIYHILNILYITPARDPKQQFVFGGNRTQWEAMGPNGRQWDPTGGNGTQWEATRPNGRQRDPTGGNGTQREATGPNAGPLEIGVRTSTHTLTTSPDPYRASSVWGI